MTQPEKIEVLIAELKKRQGDLLIIGGADFKLNQIRKLADLDRLDRQFKTDHRQIVEGKIARIIEIVGQLRVADFQAKEHAANTGNVHKPIQIELVPLAQYHPVIRRLFFRKLEGFSGSQFHIEWAKAEKRRITELRKESKKRAAMPTFRRRK